MALDSSDLQQRRRSTARQMKSSDSGTTTTARRRRRRASQDRTALFVATVLLGALFIPIALMMVAHRLHSRSDDASSSSTVNNGFLLNWKPGRRKVMELPSDSSLVEEDPESKERDNGREERYRALYRPKFDTSSLGYDIYDCPFHPPPGYPRQWKATEVLKNWNPKDVTTLSPAHRDIYQGLCVFDYQTQYTAALNYRNEEKPFVIRNDPKVMSAVRRWGDDPEYLHRALGDVEQFRTERSPNNQFMWYRLRGKNAEPEGYDKPPNDEIEMTFGEWLEHALEKDGKALGDEAIMARAAALKERRLGMRAKPAEDDPLGDDEESGDGGDEDTEESKKKKYYYFRINVGLKKARKPSPDKFVYDELPFLDPRMRRESEFYIVNPEEERGINCRFGMRGVTAANHFDMSRNTIAILGGERRYVLASPDQCARMALYPKGHPSLRHSSIDWSDPLQWDDAPEFRTALVNEVVLRGGDVLYLPTSWFHYIVSLSLNFQCNARSGTTYENRHHIEECGFPMHARSI